MAVYSDFGLWLKTELLRKNMSQRQLSAITNINEKVISDIIFGRNTKQAHIDLIRKTLEEKRA